MGGGGGRELERGTDRLGREGETGGYREIERERGEDGERARTDKRERKKEGEWREQGRETAERLPQSAASEAALPRATHDPSRHRDPRGNRRRLDPAGPSLRWPCRVWGPGGVCAKGCAVMRCSLCMRACADLPLVHARVPGRCVRACGASGFRWGSQDRLLVAELVAGEGEDGEELARTKGGLSEGVRTARAESGEGGERGRGGVVRGGRWPE